MFKTKLLAMARVMVFNATFNTNTAISWRSVLLVEETGVLGENNPNAANHNKIENNKQKNMQS